MDVLLTQFAQLPIPVSSMASSMAAGAALQAVLNASDAASSSSSNTTTLPSGSSTSHGFFSTFTNLWALILSYPAIRDGAKLFVLGGAIEFARRMLMYVWNAFLESFMVTAEFAEGDETFMWMMFWLSKQPKWNKARAVRVSTSRYGSSGVADMLPGEEDETGTIDPKRRLQYTPLHNTTHYMWFKGAWLSISRSKTQGDWWNRGDEHLTVTMFTRSQDKLNELLLEAKRAYKSDAEGRINIWVADQYNDWSLAGSRPKRPLASVVLDQGIKEHLLADARDFMANEKWYAARGIPWRRGYLLHGHPGTGKTSLIHSLAGELDLDIYIVSLSKKGLDDSSLNELISRLPSKSLALMEDIDAAFFRGLTREDRPSAAGSDSSGNGNENGGDPNGTGTDGKNAQTQGGPANGGPPAAQQLQTPSTGVTLSGLLGAIDGVAAQEGRLLFATTNKYKSLDPALIRPGRLDVHVQFDNAGKWQVEELFKCFFPPTVPVPVEDGEGEVGNGGDDAEDAEDDATLVAESEGTLTPPSSSSSKPSAIFTSDPGVHSPPLSSKQVARLAKVFAQRIPDREFSMAAIQGLLMQYKTRPYLAVQDAEKWVEGERVKKAEREGKGVVKKEEGKKKEGKENEKKVDSLEGDVKNPSWYFAFGAL